LDYLKRRLKRKNLQEQYKSYWKQSFEQSTIDRKKSAQCKQKAGRGDEKNRAIKNNSFKPLNDLFTDHSY